MKIRTAGKSLKCFGFMRSICVFTIAVSCLASTGARAAEQTSDNVLDKRLTLYGGARFYQAEGKFSSTKEGRPKIEIDMDDLGLDENAVNPIAGAMLRLGKRWNLRMDYFGYHENGKREAGFSFNFGDLNVPIGARLDSSLDLDLYVVNLSYNLIHTERARFGLGIGVHAAAIDLSISATVTVAGKEVSLGKGDEEFVAPLPNLYATGAYAFTDRFILRYGGGWMSLSYDDYDGSLYFADIFLEYWPFRHFGLGAGYRYISVDVEYDPGDKREEYNVKLPGPVAYMTLGF